MANPTYIKINFPISQDLKNYILAQPGIVGEKVDNGRFSPLDGAVFESTLTAQQGQNLVTQVASQKLVEFLTSL